MPKGKRYNKKQSSKKMEEQVVKIVREELAHELEEKRAIEQIADVNVPTVIASGDVTTSGNFLTLLPPIKQLAANKDAAPTAAQGAYGFRIGDEINLKSIKIKGYVYMRDLTTDQNNATRIGVRVMILKQKDKNTYQGFLEDAHTDKLLLDQVDANGVQGPGPFDGSPLDLMKDINRNEFAVRYDKLFYLSRDLLIGSAQNSNRSGISSKDTLKFFEHELTFGQRGKKMTFTDGSALAPNEFPYVMVVGCADLTDPTTVIGDNLVKVTYNATAVYTDA